MEAKISLVRQSTARKSIPRVLTPKEFKALLKELAEPYKAMVLVAGCLGLRASELIGLQWGDIDWGNLTVFIRRSASGSHICHSRREVVRSGTFPVRMVPYNLLKRMVRPG
ncbi:MAG: tyrosine-type recombinase/integrase [Terriglobia bacterium]